MENMTSSPPAFVWDDRRTRTKEEREHQTIAIHNSGEEGTEISPKRRKPNESKCSIPYIYPEHLHDKDRQCKKTKWKLYPYALDDNLDWLHSKINIRQYVSFYISKVWHTMADMVNLKFFTYGAGTDATEERYSIFLFIIFITIFFLHLMFPILTLFNLLFSLLIHLHGKYHHTRIDGSTHNLHLIFSPFYLFIISFTLFIIFSLIIRECFIVP